MVGLDCGIQHDAGRKAAHGAFGQRRRSPRWRGPGPGIDEAERGDREIGGVGNNEALEIDDGDDATGHGQGRREP